MTASNNFGTAYYQVTDTTDRAAEIKIHSAVVKHMSAQNLAPNFMLFPAYNSIAAGVEVSEIVTNSQRPERLIVAVNYAPPDKKEGTKDNIRNDFFCADLGKGVVVCGTSNGFEFSYIKPLIQNLYRLTNTNHLLSQFRSLEVLPQHAVLFSDPDKRDRLVAERKLERIENIGEIVPSIPDVTHVMEVDNFGNIKIILSKNDEALLKRRLLTSEDRKMPLEERAKRTRAIYFAFGEAAIQVGKNDIKFGKFHKALAARTFFAVPLGTSVLAARSSSRLADGRDVPVIANVRLRPGETLPEFAKEGKLPVVGAPVFLVGQKPRGLPASFRLSLGD